MIAVCAELADDGAWSGLGVRAARAAARAGAAVQLVGVVPDEPGADRHLLELAAAGVGHAASLRGAARHLEAADLELALRYLPDVRVVVAAGLPAELAAVAAGAATWSAAVPVVVLDPRTGDANEAACRLPAEAIVLQAPASDPDGTFAGFVGAVAARLDAGATPADAWAATTAALAVDPVAARRREGPTPGTQGPRRGAGRAGPAPPRAGG